MKVRAILEFDLVDEDDNPIMERNEYVWAAEAVEDAIRSRLMGDGFLSADTLIGTYTLGADVSDACVSDPDAEALMMQFGGVWGEHPDHAVDDWLYAIGHGDTRSGYWSWVSARMEDADDG